VDLTQLNYTTSSASFVPTDGSLCLFPWEGGKHSNIIYAYFEVNGTIAGGGEGDSWSAELYDRTNTTQLVSVSAGGSSIQRSTDISDDLPSGSATLDVRIANIGATSVALKSARLILVEEPANTSETRIYIPVGQGFTIKGQSYLSGSGESLSADCEHQFKYLAANWDTIDAAYFYANIKAVTTGTTAYAQLDNVGATDSMGEVSTANNVPTLLKSADISGDLTNAGVYTAYLKNSGLRNSSTMYNGWLVFELSSVIKYEFVYDIAAFGKYESSNTGWQSSNDYRVTYNTGDSWYYDIDSEVIKHTAVIGHSGTEKVTGAIYDDSVRNATSEVDVTATGANYLESSALTIADGSELVAGWNVDALGFFEAGILFDSSLLVTIIVEEEEEGRTRRFF